jgi:charged multivesicular body protein 2A
MAGNAAMAGVMGNVAGVMKQVNDAVSTADVAKVMQQFAQQNEMMGLREELMDDALIDAFDGEGVEEESDAIVNQVLTEVSCTLILSVYIWL